MLKDKKEKGIPDDTKQAVYKTVVTGVVITCTSLLHGCELWTLYACHIRKLNQFHVSYGRFSASDERIKSLTQKFCLVATCQAYGPQAQLHSGLIVL